MMFQDHAWKWTHIQQDKMGHITGPGGGIAFAVPRIGFVNTDNTPSVHLGLSFEISQCSRVSCSSRNY